MQIWLNFWILIFWISILSFFFNYFNMLIIIFFSELVWIILYCTTVFFACKNDDIINISLSFMFLGLAGMEFCIGLIILILFKKLNFSFILNENENISHYIFFKNNKNV